MNSITHTLSGLASSLFLNVGLTQVAQKLDPVSTVENKTSSAGLSSEPCGWPCQFTSEKGQ